MQWTCLLVPLMLFGSPSLARDNYLDTSAGSDTNTGTTAARPFASLAQLRSLRLEPGDAVRFRRGSTFRGRLSFVGNGVQGSPIRLTTYGEGPKVVNSRERVAVRINEQAVGTELRNNLILTLDP